MQRKTLKTLEYDKILEAAAKFCTNESAVSAMLETVPAEDFSACSGLLARTREADLIGNFYLADPIASFDDISEILKKAPRYSTLSPGEILRAGRVLRAGRIFKSTLEGIESAEIPIFRGYAEAVFDDLPFEKEIEDKILSEDTIADSASEKLASVRKRIKRSNEEIREKLTEMISSSNYTKYLQDNLVTLRNGRYVVPVRAEYKNNIPGLVHDQSASGSTVFLEPTAVVNLNNELRLLYLEEQEEIEKILADLTAKIAARCGELERSVGTLVEADVAFAKARFAKRNDSVCPQLNTNGFTSIEFGRHPLIDKTKVVPVSVSFGKEYRLLTITGPNTGGKTVTLKLVGLLTLMAMSGMYIPAGENSRIAVYPEIYCDIGDEQSIEQSLSTFSSHIKNITDILSGDLDSALLLLDELGAGTDPEEGAALALAVMDRILETNARAIVTTHYGEVKEYSIVTQGVMTASMQFNPHTFAPTYRLDIGVAGSSNAIEIARQLGLDPGVVARAKGYLSEEKISFETVLQRAERARFQAEETLAGIAATKAEYEKKLALVEEEREKLAKERDALSRNAKAEARRIVAETEERAEEMIGELKKILSAEELSEKDLFHARGLKKKLADLKYEEPEPVSAQVLREVHKKDLKPGRRVFVRRLNTEAEILSVHFGKGEARVRAGSVTTTVPFSELFEPKERRAPEPKAVRHTLALAPQEGVSFEINLLGRTVDEAIPEVDAFLDRAAMQSAETVKIIHGVGTGRLRAGIWEHLRRHPLVASYRAGKYGEGELGVTIVTLK